MPLGFLNFTVIDLLDILMVAALIYFAFRWIKGSTAVNIFIAIILVLLAQIIASSIGMKMVSSVLGTIIDVGAIALIIIFQPEIRRFLNSLGRKAGDTLEKRGFLHKIFNARIFRGTLDAKSITEICEACNDMAEQKTGALIVLRKNDALDAIIDTGDVIEAQISKRLIMNIFFKNSPLHDGAMIIGNNRIIAARCTLPISERKDLPARFGMRHKAAVGITEQCDADVIVVSEQTGKISFVRAGRITPVNGMNKLKLLLGEDADSTSTTGQQQ